jgi:hypothetical protein
MTRRLRTSDGLAVAAFTLWVVAPIVALIVEARREGAIWGGAWAAITPADQYRYLAWIRDAGDHLLISNAFSVDSIGHVYLHPIFLLSGLAWRLGASLQLSYLLWLPVAITVLVYGFRSYIARFLDDGWPRRSALILALFFFTPLLPMLDYGSVFTADSVAHAVNVAGAAAPYWQAWGYLPTLVALGLMPLYLLGLEAIVDPERRSAGRGARWYAIWTAIAGLVVAWLHPWGGLTLLLITAGLVAWDRFAPRSRALLVPGLATIAPLAYYWALERHDPAWGLSQLRMSYDPGQPLWTIAFAYAPLVVLAALAIRGGEWLLRRRALILWPAAALAVYFVVSPAAALPALEGATLPLVVLAVQGWLRLRLPAGLAVAAIFLSALPGMGYSAHTFTDFLRAGEVPYILKRDDLAAVRHIGRTPGNGSVLSSPYIGNVVPAFSGRAPWVAFRGLSPVFSHRYDEVQPLFDGKLTPPQVRRLLSASGAEYVLADCLHPADLTRDLAPAGTMRFGCAALYRVPGRT